jgi:N-acyl-L-homoserine lactone synthetase
MMAVRAAMSTSHLASRSAWICSAEFDNRRLRIKDRRASSSTEDRSAETPENFPGVIPGRKHPVIGAATTWWASGALRRERPVIQTIDSTNMHLHFGLMRSFAALRYEVFIRQLGWKIPTREPGFEEDQFDDGHAKYLVVTDSSGAVRGGLRLLDTSRRSLLGEVFPQLVDGPAPADPRVFEVTRFVAPRIQADGGCGSVCMELLWGLQTYGLWAGLTHLVSVSYIALEPILRRAGYRFRRLGPVVDMDGSRVVALQHDVDESVQEQSRRRLTAPGAFSHSEFDVRARDQQAATELRAQK